MAIDLLRMDRDCQMPTILRKRWVEKHGYDPVQAEKTCRFLFLLFVVDVVITISAGFVLLCTSFSVLFFVVLSVFAMLSVPTFLKWSKYKKKARAFSNALEKLTCALQSYIWIPSDALYRYNESELTSKAREGMIEQVKCLLQEEGLAKNNTGWKEQEAFDKSVFEQRKWLKEVHTCLLSFSLVEEEWDSYFAEVEEELNKEQTAEAATSIEDAMPPLC